MNRKKALKKAKEILLPMVSHARREPGWPYRHGLRTANLSQWLRERLFPGEAWMDEILYAAALFHDCAKDNEADHGQAGATRAEGYLSGIATQKELPVITHAISIHNKRGIPCSDLEKVLQDADVLDHFGSIEVWLNVSYSVLGGVGPEKSLDFYDREWSGTVKDLRQILNFDLSKSIYDDRARFSDEFAARLRVEAAGGVVGFD